MSGGAFKLKENTYKFETAALIAHSALGHDREAKILIEGSPTHLKFLVSLICFYFISSKLDIFSFFHRIFSFFVNIIKISSRVSIKRLLLLCLRIPISSWRRL